jgi:hypothetical protein
MTNSDPLCTSKVVRECAGEIERQGRQKRMAEKIRKSDRQQMATYRRELHVGEGQHAGEK